MRENRPVTMNWRAHEPGPHEIGATIQVRGPRLHCPALPINGVHAVTVVKRIEHMLLAISIPNGDNGMRTRPLTNQILGDAVPSVRNKPQTSRLTDTIRSQVPQIGPRVTGYPRQPMKHHHRRGSTIQQPVTATRNARIPDMVDITNPAPHLVNSALRVRDSRQHRLIPGRRRQRPACRRLRRHIRIERCRIKDVVVWYEWSKLEISE
jgi:hypothetical protein